MAEFKMSAATTENQAQTQTQNLTATVSINDSNSWFTGFHHLTNIVKTIEDKIVIIEYETKQIGALSDALRDAIETINTKKPSMEIVDMIEEEEDSLE